MSRSSIKRFLSKRKIHLSLLIIWLVVFLFYSYLAFAVPHRNSFLSPDENNTYCVAKQIRTRNTVYLHSHLNEKLGMKIFRGRLYVEAGKNRYTAFNSLGLSFLVAGGMYLGLAFFVVPFLASLGAIGIYLVLKEMAGERAGLMASALYGLLPTNVFISNQILDATPSFSMYLVSLGCILAATKRKSVFLPAISGTALGLCFFIRQANAIYIIALLALLFTLRKKLDMRQWSAFLATAGTMALATMTMNKLVYGSLYRSGQIAGSKGGPFQTIFPKMDFNAVLNSLSNHLVAYLPLLLVLGIVGFVLACKGKPGTSMKALNTFMASLAVLTVVSYASRSGTWSFSTYSITSSMARYFIPLYAVVIIYASLYLEYALRRGRKTAVLLVLTVTLCMYALFTFGDLEYMNLQRLVTRAETIGQAKASLLASFDQPIVVFTKHCDKDLYDDVQVGLCYTREDVAREPDIKALFPIVDIEREVLPAIDHLLEDGYLVLAASDCPELLVTLTERGYRTSRSEEYNSLYVVRKSEKQE